MSARPPSRTSRKTRVRSLGSGGRAGSHSQRARKAASRRSAHGPCSAASVLCRAARPGAVGKLVVVERGDHRQLLVQLLDVRVAPVLRIAPPVVGQGPALLERVERPADVRARGLALRRRVRRLVDVVPQMQQEVELLVLGDAGIGVEEAGVVLGARAEREANALASIGQGLGPPDRREARAAGESVVVGGARLQAAGVDVHRVVVVGMGDRRAPRDHVGQRLVTGDHPPDRHADLVSGDSCPQHDAIGERVAAGHAVVETDAGVCACGGRTAVEARAGGALVGAILGGSWVAATIAVGAARASLSAIRHPRRRLSARPRRLQPHARERLGQRPARRGGASQPTSRAVPRRLHAELRRDWERR